MIPFFMQCNRCGHQWLRRVITTDPVLCPKCKSQFWNRERVYERPEDIRARWQGPEPQKKAGGARAAVKRGGSGTGSAGAKRGRGRS